ncbi:unnamed protein product [Bursaphelenchus xylophilus]|uniref:Peroxisomal biogenesis factor 3 n=1 Tax=Bursaphelenchus xylophilus TaxID=6326 RepID=A0A1I7RRG5_BURXY|nr:unnamed protein product [Bursaphelenchus xylophilus]CAG9131022.1 unnamed protein product [Bursaphelenchus xylophilus]
MEISDIWGFVKRHRGKIAAATTVLGGIYAAKKVLESEQVRPYVQEGWPFVKGNGTESKEEDGFRLLQSRKAFIFDCHQQSSDKEIAETVTDMISAINNRFNTDSLVHRLRTEEGIEQVEKVAIWEDIKIKTIARIVALAYCHSLILMVLKTQKSILCREAIRNLEGSMKPKSGLVDYVSAFFWEPANGPSQVFTDPKAQEVFLHCIQYLTCNGLSDLFNRIENITEKRLGQVSLAKEFNCSSLLVLLEKIKFDLDNSAGQSNYAEFVVPISRTRAPSSSAYNSAHLEELLTRLTDSFQTSQARSLISSFVKKYLCESIEFLDQNLETVKPVPLAKLLPTLSDGFPKLASAGFDSVLQRNLADPDLYKYCQTVCYQ